MESNPPVGADPGIAEYRRLLAAGNLQRAQFNYAEAAKSYRAALRYQPNNAVTYALLSTVLLEEYRKSGAKSLLHEALQAAQESIRLAPLSALTHNQLGYALLASGRKADSLKHHERALELAPQDANCHLGLGNYWLKCGDPDKAFESYQTVLKLEPRNVAALVNCGTCQLLYKRDWEVAEAYAREALSIDAGYGYAQLLMGRLYLRKGQVAEAMEQVRLVVSRNPSSYEAAFLIAMIECKRNWFRGLGFRVAVFIMNLGWSRKQFSDVGGSTGLAIFLFCIMFQTPALFFLGILGVFYGTLLFLVVLVQNMKRYVRKNYLAPEKLKRNF